MSSPPARTWAIVLVEDDDTMGRQVKEYLEGERFPFGALRVISTTSFEQAVDFLRERKVDLLILDVYRGEIRQGDTAGLTVLKQWQSTGFAPVILHTALAEGLAAISNVFIRVVPKETGNLPRLAETINELFALRIPQIHRAIVEHLDASLRTYMWGFVVTNWSEIHGLVAEPDFMRLLLRRLALEFSRNLAPVINIAYSGASATDPEPEKVHPAEYYVKPPVGNDPQLGDLRLISWGDRQELFAVVWPSCDLVERNGRYKVDRALCARALRLEDCDEYKKWAAQATPGRATTSALVALMSNNRGSGQADRYYFLPPAWDIPPLVLDFGDLEHLPVAELTASRCIATLASPFAEAIGARFVRYVGRLGTPALDMDIMLAVLKQRLPI